MSHLMKRSLLLLLLLSLLGGCVYRPGPPPPEPGQENPAMAQAMPLHGEAYLRTDLFFGMSIATSPDHPAGEVTEAQWRDFLNTWITPRFPYGLTVINGYGQWLGSNGSIAKEHSKVLVLLHPDTQTDWAETNQAIEQIRAAYCRLFHQESVLRVTSRAGVAF